MIKAVATFIVLLTIQNIWGQDPQFSQYYSAPLLLNPALTGASECERVGVNARTQWVGLNRPYSTFAAYTDMNLNHLKSGVGIMFLHDNAGQAHLTSNEVSLFYSYHTHISKHANIRFGLQATWVNRSIQYNQLIFEDQFTDLQVTQGFTSDPIADYTRHSYFDITSGALLFGENYWVGFAARHLNTPNQSFYTGESQLPRTFTLHGGYNISFFHSHGLHHEKDKSIHITPTFIYKSQTKYDQLDVGMYLLRSKLLFGIWYRGIYFKEDEGVINSDALILQVGIKPKDFSFIYSYDMTTSKLGQKNTYGSHEISIIYEFCAQLPHRKNKNYKKLPCPDFLRYQKYQKDKMQSF